ncbi:TPA: alpha-1,2-fucosyltransferase, partial [Escherichia coli]
MYSCLSGGLGNQMFQYAAAYILQRKLKQRSLVLDDSYFLDCSNR